MLYLGYQTRAARILNHLGRMGTLSQFLTDCLFSFCLGGGIFVYPLLNLLLALCA